MALYLGSNKVAGNTTSESLNNDLKNYKVTFDDSGTIGESENFTSIIGEIKTKGLVSEILRGVKKALNFLNNAIGTLNTSISNLNNNINNMSDFANMWNNNRIIDTLTSPSQINSVGIYRISSISSAVNDNLDNEAYSFDDYSIGDFHALTFDFNGNSTEGIVYGTIFITSPRFSGKFWVGRIWDKKFVRWDKYESTNISS